MRSRGILIYSNFYLKEYQARIARETLKRKTNNWDTSLAVVISALIRQTNVVD